MACPDCGTRREEWAANRFAYLATRHYCHGCDLIAQEREQVPEQARAAVHVGLVPNDGRDEDE